MKRLLPRDHWKPKTLAKPTTLVGQPLLSYSWAILAAMTDQPESPALEPLPGQHIPPPGRIVPGLERLGPGAGLGLGLGRIGIGLGRIGAGIVPGLEFEPEFTDRSLTETSRRDWPRYA